MVWKLKSPLLSSQAHRAQRDHDLASLGFINGRSGAFGIGYEPSFLGLLINLSHNCLMTIRVLRLSVPQFSFILSRIVTVEKVMNDKIMTLKEVAEYLKLAEKTAYRLAAEGKLPGFKAGGSWRFKQSDIEKWIEENKKGQKE